ncbi:MAG TPA: FAD-dependent oxidoreductase [Nitrososphaeraceae archaeon]|nr:FAD-dependent oxidoreductase [Nitrososphaeraceae archaeon]
MTGTQHYDLIIIGGGPAGQGAAEFAAFAGRRILVIEREVLGGLVVTTGGGPTKTLREAALHLTGFRYRALYGITEQPDIVTAVERSRARTEEVSYAIKNFTHSFFVERLGVDVIYGSARLGQNRNVIVTPREVSETELVFTAEKILIATGSGPFHPPNIPFDDPDIYDSEELPNIKRIPKSALVVGGGPIGCEFASIFSAFGIPVTVVNSGEHLLGTMDSELSDLLRRAFEKQGMRIVLGTGVHTADRVNDELQITLKTGEVLRPDMALFATGRLVDTKGLGLDSAGVKLNPRGVVEVDNHFQTNIEGLYAAGDVIGPSLASVSAEQGRVAACHALGLGFKEKLDPLSVSAVYSVPELAGVGLTEDNAKEQGIDYEIGRCSFGEIPRGLISGDTEGILKLVFRRQDRLLLGVHILGDIASELIALGQATLYNSGTIDVFNNLTVATPTYTMAYKYAAFDGFKRLATGGGSLQSFGSEQK